MEGEGRQETERYAVVTGANKGIGFEIVKQLAAVTTTRMVVVLTARDAEKGAEAIERLPAMGLHNVVFRNLDVRIPESIDSLAKFIQNNYGRLDVLVNNAGVSGMEVDVDGLKALNIDPQDWLSGGATKMVRGVMKCTPERARECLDTNYYGVKRTTEALLPLLRRSNSGPNIVNVSSLGGELKRIPNEEVRRELGELESLTEEKIDGLVERFMGDLKEGVLEEKGWCMMVPAYSISKAAVNAYTRVMAKSYGDGEGGSMRINCVHPGYVKTDINWNTGPQTVEEGARGPVMLSLLPPSGPTGCYFDRTQVSPF